ncbi:hypothetical protein EVC30_066 [Rhizobium phage RHph_Y1_11]|nr:hypothetical protein EVC30_066 [Rhizobium phage RHph_Y1_11]
MPQALIYNRSRRGEIRKTVRETNAVWLVRRRDAVRDRIGFVMLIGGAIQYMSVAASQDFYVLNLFDLDPYQRRDKLHYASRIDGLREWRKHHPEKIRRVP